MAEVRNNENEASAARSTARQRGSPMGTDSALPLYHLGFVSLDREAEIDSLRVRGDVPAWLNGTLLRTGPCKFEVGDRSYNHWFDGLAMLHRFTFADGQVTYANRFVRGHTFCEAERRGRISYAEFATDPCRTLFGKIAALFSSRPTDNCNINVSEFAGQVVALEEPGLPIRFDPTTLETLGVYGYSDQIRGRISTAHPHRDTARQRHYNYMLQFGRKSTYRLFGIDSEAGRQDVIAELAVNRPAYMHSFGMSKQHLILSEFPLVVNPLRLRFSGRPFIENYRWEPERGLRFHIVEKDTGRVLAVATDDAGFAFHHVNAFEDNDDVVVDMVAYPDSQVIQDLYLSPLRAGQPVTVAGMLTRFRIALKDGAVDRTELASEPLELPRINYAAVAGRSYRFVWGTGVQSAGGFFDSIVKIDVESGEIMRWYEPGCYPGEPVFVASPGSSIEDEGVILSVVLDPQIGRSFVLVLDASSLAERARAEVPHHIPFGFHGSYFPQAPRQQ